MRLRGVLTAFAAVLLLAAMFVAVHRGARGRRVAERIGTVSDRVEAAKERLSDLQQEIEYLRGRARVVDAAQRLGLRLPEEEELVVLDLRDAAKAGKGGTR